MMGDERRQPAKPSEASRAQMPVWSPTPGVPIISRIMAYSFGALMLLTAILEFTLSRPPDTIAPPKTQADWKFYHSSMGCSVPYPGEWLFTMTTGEHGERANMALRTKHFTQVTVISRTLSAPLDEAQYDGFQHGFEQSLSSSFAHFAATDTCPLKIGQLHRFTFDDSGFFSTEAMSGGWALLTSGNCLVQVVAVSPRVNWPDFEKIVVDMANYTSFDQAPANTQPVMEGR